MQYPSQQPPQNQSYYPPAENFVYQQPQVYAPQPSQAPEIMRPPAQTQEIAIPTNRRQATWRASVCAFCLLLLIGIFILFFSVFSSIMGNIAGEGPAELLSPVLIVFFAIFILAAVAYIGWITWGMFSGLVFSQKPLLVINRAGITVGKVPPLSGFSIAWSEIGVISVRSTLYKYLCIEPKNLDLCLRRFNALERFLRRSNSWMGIPALLVPQVYLDRPVEEILQQLYYIYSSELSYYGVQLRS